MNVTRIKRPSPAFVVAMIALFVALGGTAGAVATQAVPLAKRALVAENAKKLGGQTVAQIAAQATAKAVRQSPAAPGPASTAAGLVVIKTQAAARSRQALALARSAPRATPARRSSAEACRPTAAVVDVRQLSEGRRGLGGRRRQLRRPRRRTSASTRPVSGRGRGETAAGAYSVPRRRPWPSQDATGSAMGTSTSRCRRTIVP